MKEELENIISELKKNGYTIKSGLSEKDINEVEKFYDISFNIDHKEFLKIGLVIGDNFYNWVDFSPENCNKIREMLNWPLEGLLFDIEHNNFWYEEIEINSNLLVEKIDSFKSWYNKNVPKLIPIYSHRYMCSEPKKSGVPVYSVYQTDIIYYGMNIVDYLIAEFKLKITSNINLKCNDGTFFWSKIVD